MSLKYFLNEIIKGEKINLKLNNAKKGNYLYIFAENVV